MGQPMSILRENEEQQAQKAKEQLAMLEKMALAQLESKKQSILHGTTDDEEIHNGVVVSRHEQIRVDASSEPTEVEHALNDFFDGDVVGGIKDLVTTGVRELLGNTSIGETESEDMIIIWENNALLRIDIYYWKWNFSQKGVVDVAENIFACYFVKRVISLKHLEPNVLIYSISQMFKKRNKGADDDAALAYMGHIMEKIKEVRIKITETSNDSKPAALPA